MERNPRLGEYWLLGCHPTSLESGERVANSAPNMATTEQAASRRWISPQLGKTESRGQKVDKAFGEEQLIVRCGVRVRATRVRLCTVHTE